MTMRWNTNKQRKIKEERDKRDSMLHNYISTSKTSRKSKDTSKSCERRSPSIPALIPSPEDTKRKRAKLLEKVNKEEGVTFHPKINKFSSCAQVEKDHNTTSYFKDFSSKEDSGILKIK